MAGYVPALHRVFLVEDHDIVRRGVRDLLTAARDIEVVGESGSASTAPQEILASGADVMLLDLQLPDGSGVEVCRAVRAVDPAVSALLLTSAPEDEALLATVLAGAAGYLLKLVRSADITWAIRELRPGRSVVDPARVEDGRRAAAAGMDRVQPPFDGSERRILELVISGATDGEIGRKLGLPVPYATSLTAALVARLRQARFGSPPPAVPPGTGKHRRAD